MTHTVILGGVRTPWTAWHVYAAVRDVRTVRDVDSRLVPVQLDVPDVERVAAVAQQLGDVQLVLNNAGHRALRDVAEREAGLGPRRAVDKIAPDPVAIAAIDSVRGR